MSTELDAEEVVTSPDEADISATEETNDDLDTAQDEADDQQDDQADDDGSDADDQQDDPDAEKGKDEESRSQRRRRQRREHVERLERENASNRQRLDRLEAQLKKLTPPDADSYENPDDYIADRAAYAGQKGVIEGQIEEAKEAATETDKERQRQRAEGFKEAVAEASERLKDFDKVALGNHWSPTPAMLDVIMDSDKGPDLAYYLGSNPEEAASIAKLPVHLQAVELGRISATLAAPPKPRQSTAKPPLKPLKGGKVSATKDPDDMTYDEYAAWRTGGKKS